jgi:hypothetical protein
VANLLRIQTRLLILFCPSPLVWVGNCKHRTSLRHKLSPTVPELTADTPKARHEKECPAGIHEEGAIHRLHSRSADRLRRLLPLDRQHAAHLD